MLSFPSGTRERRERMNQGRPRRNSSIARARKPLRPWPIDEVGTPETPGKASTAGGMPGAAGFGREGLPAAEVGLFAGSLKVVDSRAPAGASGPSSKWLAEPPSADVEVPPMRSNGAGIGAVGSVDGPVGDGPVRDVPVGSKVRPTLALATGESAETVAPPVLTDASALATGESAETVAPPVLTVASGVATTETPEASD
jgi:hypothetical protein